MPPDLKARVKAAAEANNRSMNAEIVATLEEKYPAPRQVRGQELLDLLSQSIADLGSQAEDAATKGDDGLTKIIARSMRTLRTFREAVGAELIDEAYRNAASLRNKTED